MPGNVIYHKKFAKHPPAQLKDLLTARECQCFDLLIRGRSLNEIGDDLNLSVKTIDIHVRNLKSKLDCFNRSSLVDRAIEAGFLVVTDFF